MWLVSYENNCTDVSQSKFFFFLKYQHYLNLSVVSKLKNNKWIKRKKLIHIKKDMFMLKNSYIKVMKVIIELYWDASVLKLVNYGFGLPSVCINMIAIFHLAKLIETNS